MKRTKVKKMVLTVNALSAFVFGNAIFITSSQAAENVSTSNSEYLWQISKSHLKDPLAWTTIWRTTPQANDPANMKHFNHVKLDSQPEPEKPKLTAKQQTQVDWRKSEEKRTKNYLSKIGPLQPATPTKMPAQDSSPTQTPPTPTGKVKQYLSQSIVLTTPFLADGEGSGSDVIYPGETKLKYSSNNESEILQPFEEVIIQSGQNKDVKFGDLFRIYEVGENYESPHSGSALGRLVKTTGIIEIIRVGQKSSTGRLLKCFGTISRSSRACPLGTPPEISASSYTPVTDGKLSAQVAWVTEQQFPQPFSYAIIDKGQAKGFKQGDMVLFFNSVQGKMTDKVLGNGLIVDIKDKSSTILIKDIFPGIINRGDYTVVIQSTDM